MISAGMVYQKNIPAMRIMKIKNFVNDFHDLLIHLNISKFVLLSSSFATLIAREYLKQYRETITALIFTSTEAFDDNDLKLKIIRPVLKAGNKRVGVFTFQSKAPRTCRL